ncbi:unnamed protein product [Rangifer tarandus platyrhynchus]|uniref:Uncharacterized protein n=1 Tax=Rangifer tarandus platyrhynchus TaxID=3082113 RepID=A0ACB1KG68_RANTA
MQSAGPTLWKRPTAEHGDGGSGDAAVQSRLRSLCAGRGGHIHAEGGDWCKIQLIPLFRRPPTSKCRAGSQAARLQYKTAARAPSVYAELLRGLRTRVRRVAVVRAGGVADQSKVAVEVRLRSPWIWCSSDFCRNPASLYQKIAAVVPLAGTPGELDGATGTKQCHNPAYVFLAICVLGNKTASVCETQHCASHEARHGA